MIHSLSLSLLLSLSLSSIVHIQNFIHQPSTDSHSLSLSLSHTHTHTLTHTHDISIYISDSHTSLSKIFNLFLAATFSPYFVFITLLLLYFLQIKKLYHDTHLLTPKPFLIHLKIKIQLIKSSIAFEICELGP